MGTLSNARVGFPLWRFTVIHGPLLSIACLVAGWSILPATARAEDKDVKPIATVQDESRSGRVGSFDIKRNGVAIRSAEELVALTSKAKSATDAVVQTEMEAELAKILKVDSIDWKKQMVVAVIAVQVDSIKTDGKDLTVNYTPYKEPPTLAIPATPKHLLLVDHVEGEVKFVQKIEKKEKE
jgi:hypothetical protein